MEWLAKTLGLYDANDDEDEGVEEEDEDEEEQAPPPTRRRAPPPTPKRRTRIENLKCEDDDDLEEAYERLLQGFDGEQHNFAVDLEELKSRHEADLQRLREERDSAEAALAARQKRSEQALGRLEKELSANLRKRIHEAYASSLDDNSGVLEELRRLTSKQRRDLAELRKMYAELVNRLEREREDHAEAVANAAREALDRQKAQFDARMKALMDEYVAHVKGPLAEDAARLREYLDGDGARRRSQDLDVEREQQGRERSLSQQRYSAALDAIPKDLSAKMKHAIEKENRNHAPAVARYEARLQAANDKLAGLAAEQERLEESLGKARAEQAALDMELATRMAGEKRGLAEAAAEAQAEAEAAARDRLAKAVAAAKAQARAEFEAEAARDGNQGLVKMFQNELNGLRAKLAAANRDADAAEEACDRELGQKQRALQFERNQVEAMRDALMQQAHDTGSIDGDAAASLAGGYGKKNDNNNNGAAASAARGPVTEAMLAELRMDMCALREAVQETQRELEKEREKHPIRLRWLEDQIAERQSQVAALRQKATYDQGGNHDDDDDDDDGLPKSLQSEEIMRDWRRSSRSADAMRELSKPTTRGRSSSTSKEQKLSALRERLAVVAESIAAVNEELARSDGERRQVLLERLKVLEREATLLQRMQKSGRHPRRPTSSRLLARDAMAAIQAAMETQREIENKASGLDFESAPPEALAVALGGKSFVDLRFPPLDKPSAYGPGDRGPPLAWRRSAEIFGEPAPVFLSSSTGRKRLVSPRDLVVVPEDQDNNNNNNNDAWLTSALAAIAEAAPDVVRNAFPAGGDKQGAGIYRVRVCPGGLWETITLDDYFPCDPSTGAPKFARSARPELWVLLLEKAMAKWNGSYSRLRAGFAAEGLLDLAGLPTLTIDFKHLSFRQALADGAAFAQFFRAATRNKWIACVSSPGEDTHLDGRLKTPPPVLPSGLVPARAYALLAAIDVGGRKFLRLRGRRQQQQKIASNLLTPEVRAAMAAAEGPSEEPGTFFWTSFEDALQHFRSFSAALPASPAGKPWFEKRARCCLSASDPTEIYKLTLRQDAHVFVSLHQTDERQLGAPTHYVDLGVTVVQKKGPDSFDRRRQVVIPSFKLQDAVPPTLDRQIICPSFTGGDYRRPWPAGDYVVCAYTTGSQFPVLEHQQQQQGTWPHAYDKTLMRSVTREIFSRFNRRLDGALEFGDGGEVETMLSEMGLVDTRGEAHRLATFERTTTGLVEPELAEWLSLRSDWRQILRRLGYCPSEKKDDPPRLADHRRVALAVHADALVSLQKLPDEPTLVEQAQELPLLERGHRQSYPNVDVFVLSSAKGASLLAKNVADVPRRVRVDASKSKNCKSHTGHLDVSVLLAPDQALIVHHFSPAKRGAAWGYTFDVQSQPA
ncbi:hypothetical protein CTAYLR_005203 [Chrysophaeum taylorii]|uniref:Calpain catalytic domain-containing protein n=1 Tax=Chrysophaeum taylorii TaxID=2483200 RepID=A0AAD7XMP8_9STRA|nr:hypothetical protein CTAYLR_005203 [Chrysophaeum taylorii]